MSRTSFNRSAIGITPSGHIISATRRAGVLRNNPACSGCTAQPITAKLNGHYKGFVHAEAN